MTPSLLAYRAAMGALHPFAPALLRRRARAGKEDRDRLPERLGHASLPRPDGALAWLHAASVGESLSLLPLIARLSAARPDLALLVTSGTTTSAELLAKRLPAGVIHQYAPLDVPRSAHRFLDHWRPTLAVFVESDLWPNLLLGARARGARLALLSARLSPGSLRNWGRTPGFAQRVFSAFDLVMAQDPCTGAALARLGAPNDGLLNLKLAGEPLPVDAALQQQATQAAAGRPVLLAASTHPGEERLALEAYAPLGAEGDSLLVIVPRHPSRGAEAAELARAQGWSTGLRSQGALFGADRVHVADTLGELGLWFRVADGAWIGGGSTPGVGGHNPLEPARLDCPLASGVGVENWRGVYDGLAAAQALVWTPDAAALTAFWRRAADREPDLRARAARARAYAESGSGQLEAATARLLALLP
jgi:3-deoxy-D-manno-octulosonic-acid transferase